MKVVFYVSLSIVLFLVGFSFIVQNPHDTKIYYYFGIVWDGPVATLLILTFGVGMLFGALASSVSILKLKLRLIKATKHLRALQTKGSLGHERKTKEGD